MAKLTSLSELPEKFISSTSFGSREIECISILMVGRLSMEREERSHVPFVEIWFKVMESSPLLRGP